MRKGFYVDFIVWSYGVFVMNFVLFVFYMDRFKKLREFCEEFWNICIMMFRG